MRPSVTSAARYLTMCHFSVIGMDKVATLERWGSFWRIVVTYERSGGRPTLKNWTYTLSCTYFCTDEFYGELFFEYENDWFVGDVIEWRDEKNDGNIARRKRRVRELALCNAWEYFGTFTLASDKQDRNDLALFYKRFGEWVGNYNKRYGTHLKYLLIPEQHKNGAWHAHGLLSGVAKESLVRNEFGYLDMPAYRKRFGFISLSEIRDRFRTANYITKYISKDLSGTNLGRNRNGYISSRGLKVSEKIDSRKVSDDFVSAWSNGFCGVTFGKETNVRDSSALLREIERGNNPLYDGEHDSAEKCIALVNEWKKWYNDNIARPFVWNPSVNTFWKGE